MDLGSRGRPVWQRADGGGRLVPRQRTRLERGQGAVWRRHTRDEGVGQRRPGPPLAERTTSHAGVVRCDAARVRSSGRQPQTTARLLHRKRAADAIFVFACSALADRLGWGRSLSQAFGPTAYEACGLALV